MPAKPEVRGDAMLSIEAYVSAAGEVSCTAVSGCPRCACGEGCGQAAWSAPRLQSIRLALPTGSTALHTPVTLVLPASRLLRAAWLAYGLPLIGLTGGAVLGHFLGGDPFAVGGSLVGLVTAWLLGRALAARAGAGLLPEMRELQGP
jgi:sigma-E factor negative regulatory protein RseC